MRLSFAQIVQGRGLWGIKSSLPCHLDSFPRQDVLNFGFFLYSMQSSPFPVENSQLEAENASLDQRVSCKRSLSHSWSAIRRMGRIRPTTFIPLLTASFIFFRPCAYRGGSLFRNKMSLELTKDFESLLCFLRAFCRALEWVYILGALVVAAMDPNPILGQGAA